jgi:metal-responsive CopG/Arc/MetJ family transcriptional regulator
MPRTIIDIPDAQLREVDRLCRQLAISRAEAVRRGLGAWLEQNTEVNTKGFGLWRDGPASGAAGRTAKRQ